MEIGKMTDDRRANDEMTKRGGAIDRKEEKTRMIAYIWIVICYRLT
jgi:hypothetical protein